MKHSAVLVVLVSALLTTAGAAFAVLPKKGGTYVGDIKSAPFAMHINVRVSPTGTTLQHFTYLCGTGRAPTTVFEIPVDRTSHFQVHEDDRHGGRLEDGWSLPLAYEGVRFAQLDRLRRIKGIDNADPAVDDSGLN